MKKYIIGLLTIVLSTTLFGQQIQTSSFYDMQGAFHNPGMAGIRENNFIGLTYKSQWSGISGAPTTATIFGSFDIPKHQIGIAANIYTDKTGPTSRTGIQIDLAKHIELGNDDKLSIGLTSRLQQFAIDKSQLMQSLGNDPVLAGSNTSFTYDAGFGVAYKSKKIELGASVSQLVQSKLKFYTGNLSTSQTAMLYRHYYLHGAYNWNVDGNTTITPNFLLIYLPNAPTDFVIGARVEHSKTFWWGLGYRANQSYIIQAGINISKKITVGYCYDDYIKPLSLFDGGSNGNEFILKYNFIK